MQGISSVAGRRKVRGESSFTSVMRLTFWSKWRRCLGVNLSENEANRDVLGRARWMTVLVGKSSIYAVSVMTTKAMSSKSSAAVSSTKLIVRPCKKALMSESLLTFMID